MQKFITTLVVLWCVAGSYSLSISGLASHFVGQSHSHDENVNEAEGNPAFCRNLDCPKYKVIHKTEDYEVRRYDQVIWAKTSTAAGFGRANFHNFRRLYSYIDGGNDAGKEIPMTAPVLMKVNRGQDDNFTMAFYMVGDMADLPKPTNPAVYLHQTPARMLVFVKQFDGYYMRLSSWQKKAKELADAIRDPSVYHTSFFYGAGYNSPMQLMHRHNEIWFIATRIAESQFLDIEPTDN